MKKFQNFISSSISSREHSIILFSTVNSKCVRLYSSRPSIEPDEEFRVLDLKKMGANSLYRGRKVDKKAVARIDRGRADKMHVDQDWTAVWPGPRSFHPAVVPLPIRQGINKLGAPPGKFGNAELMKIPNFLHVTPPAVDKHTAALKKFCTPWPKGLEDDDQCRKHFPLEVTTSDYCHSAPVIRDPLARIVTIKFPLSRLELDAHAKDKFLRLVGDRYDPQTDTVTILTDKCPLKQQNYEYAMYLLTALYHESWNLEEWEKEKTDADMEFYDWDNSQSKINVERTLTASNRPVSISDPLVQAYAKAVNGVFDEGENDYNWEKYQEASIKLLFPD